MASERKFWKLVYTVEVLCEDNDLANALCDHPSLYTIYREITNGECSGVVNGPKVMELRASQAVKALQEQGSDPEFFGLDGDGNDI